MSYHLLTSFKGVRHDENDTNMTMDVGLVRNIKQMTAVYFKNDKSGFRQREVRNQGSQNFIITQSHFQGNYY
jgi:hypothetical protein